MQALWQDVRYGLRMLTRNPGFTTAVVLCLAFGIGANTAIFSIVNAVLLRPLPCGDPDRLLRLYERCAEQELLAPSGICLAGCRERNQSFEDMAAYGFTFSKLAWPGNTEIVLGIRGTVNLLKVLGINPVLGRDFLPDEDTPAASHVVLLTHDMWQQRFGADPKAVGKTLMLDNEPYTVVGVVPDGINFLVEPSDLLGNRAGILIPLRVETEKEEHWMCAIARLRKHVTLEAAGRDLDAVLQQIYRERPSPGADIAGAALVRFNDDLTKTARPLLLLLQGAGLFVLLIACVNVANLLFARGVARQNEIAVRVALGAGRFRITQQLFVESLLLSLAGGMLGILLALWEIDLFLAVAPSNVPRLTEARIDGAVFGFVLLVSLLTAALFGTMQGLRVFRGTTVGVSATGVRVPSLGRRQHRLLSLSVVLEILLTMVLLKGAALMLNSFWRLSRVDPGFNPENLLTAALMFPGEKYSDTGQIVSLTESLLQRLSAIPRVRAAGASSVLPMTSSEVCRVEVEGRSGSDPVNAQIQRVTDNYFQVMGISVLEGQSFTGRASVENRGQVLINRTLAREFFGEEDPLGKRLVMHGLMSRYAEIVGVTVDVKTGGLGAKIEPTVYVPFVLEPCSPIMLVIRTAGPPTDVVEDVRGQVWAADPDVSVALVRPMADIVSKTIARHRFALFLLASFAVTALLLATFGVYGLCAYSVGLRTHEIGIRMALGAQRSDVFHMVLRQGLVLTASGLVLGLIVSNIFTRYLASMLYEIKPTDPATLIGAAALLSAVAMVACYVPARRATDVDPVVAIRYE